MTTIDKSSTNTTEITLPSAAALFASFPQHFHSGNDAKVLQLAGDASSRKYFRIHSGFYRKSYVLQEDQPFVAVSEEQHPYIAALKLFDELTHAVPKLQGTDASRGWILLEDLGDITLQLQITDTHYERAMELIADWILNAEVLRQKNDPLLVKSPHNAWAFDFEKLNFEMNWTAKHLFEGYLKIDPTEFLECVEPNTQYLAKRPRFWCHRDYHCRNLMLHDDKLFIIDFQDARWGPLSYDIVSILWDPYVRLKDSQRTQLLDFWRSRLLMNGAKLKMPRLMDVFATHSTDENSFEHELERMKIQRLLKAAGSYASFYVTKGRQDYLPSVKPAIQDTIAALETLVQRKESTFADARLLTLLTKIKF